MGEPLLGPNVGQPPDNGCKLVAGRFAALVQFVLMWMALSALLLKRRMEVPRRDFKVWLLDSGKQCIGGLFIHFCNLGVSMLFAHAMGRSATAGSKDECAFYFFNFLVDTTIGLAIIWLLLQILERAARALEWTSLANTGEYGDPPRMGVWGAQLGAWLVVLGVSKMLVASCLFAMRQHLALLGNEVFGAFAMHPKVELVFVMVVGPGLMNGFQFWVQDSFLKKDEGAAAAKAHQSPRVGSIVGGNGGTAAGGGECGPLVELSSGAGRFGGYHESPGEWEGSAEQLHIEL